MNTSSKHRGTNGLLRTVSGSRRLHKIWPIDSNKNGVKWHFSSMFWGSGDGWLHSRFFCPIMAISLPASDYVLGYFPKNWNPAQCSCRVILPSLLFFKVSSDFALRPDGLIILQRCPADAKLNERGSGSLIKPFHLMTLAIHFSPLSFGLFDCFD